MRPSVDTPWVPEGWSANPRRLLVLGESAYAGSFAPEHALAKNWVPAYLRQEVPDPLYSKVANAIRGASHGMGLAARRAFWNEVAFANFVVLAEGTQATARPTPAEYRTAAKGLAAMLDDLHPQGVWIWGVEQSEYSLPVVQRANIACVVVAHPVRGYSKTLAESWANLQLAIGGH